MASESTDGRPEPPLPVELETWPEERTDGPGVTPVEGMFDSPRLTEVGRRQR